MLMREKKSKQPYHSQSVQGFQWRQVVNNKQTIILTSGSHRITTEVKDKKIRYGLGKKNTNKVLILRITDWYIFTGMAER